MTSREFPLGMRRATDDLHIQRYSLTADYVPLMPTSCVAGTNWWSRFDTPYTDSADHHWMLEPGRSLSDLGTLRGGHAWCLNAVGVADAISWWDWYDQPDGSCVGFSWSRAMSHQNRMRYLAHKLYEFAQSIDEFTDTPPEEGTSVRAGADVLRLYGHWRPGSDQPDPRYGIDANRWARTIEDVALCLSPLDGGRTVLNRGWITMRNSWGRRYPHAVRVSLDLLHELAFNQDGEVAVMTDR